jgi:hypothetical protein
MHGRNARQCRHRYNNYLIDRSQFIPWTDLEEEILVESYRSLGPKWVEIATHLPGRTGNDVKNRWHKHILKRPGIGLRSESDTDDVITPSDHPIVEAPHQLGGILTHGPPKVHLSPFLQFVLN